MSLAGKREPIPVTVIVSTKNEETAIEQCLIGLRAFDQVFVVDSMSSDATVDIARQHGAEVIEFCWNGKYPKKKQWCLDNVNISHDWVLFSPTPPSVDSRWVRGTWAGRDHCG